jgi:hypothetical protein
VRPDVTGRAAGAVVRALAAPRHAGVGVAVVGGGAVGVGRAGDGDALVRRPVAVNADVRPDELGVALGAARAEAEVLHRAARETRAAVVGAVRRYPAPRHACEGVAVVGGGAVGVGRAGDESPPARAACAFASTRAAPESARAGRSCRAPARGRADPRATARRSRRSCARGGCAPPSRSPAPASDSPRAGATRVSPESALRQAAGGAAASVT